MTERDLELEYLRDTGNHTIRSKYVEVEYDHRTEDRVEEISVDIQCTECHEMIYDKITETIYGTDESGSTDVIVECVDEDFHKWCVEKLLKLINDRA